MGAFTLTTTHAHFPRSAPIIGAMYSAAGARPMGQQNDARLPGRICDAPLMVSADVRPSTSTFSAYGSSWRFAQCPRWPNIFSDLIGKLDAVRVTCPSRGRDGRYNLRTLIDGRGGQGKIIDWLDEITADCPKKMAASMNDQCDARCPDLPRVL